MSPAGETPAADAPTAETLRRARLLWEQGCADLKEARRRLRARAPLDASYLSVQAAVNALTSVCYLHGEFRVPAFSTFQLASLLEGFDADFATLVPDARALEEAQELNPYAAERDAADEQRRAGLYYAHSDSILKAVRGYLKRHRRRFFAP